MFQSWERDERRKIKKGEKIEMKIKAAWLRRLGPRREKAREHFSSKKKTRGGY